jgi:DNA helicase-2/ATP-dependent DNA helicase PcrA
MINELKKGIDNPFVEVLVDEYQDTNPLQNEFIENVKKNLFCVGDYDQSIYAFILLATRRQTHITTFLVRDV